jgi:hypothetical protein
MVELLAIWVDDSIELLKYLSLILSVQAER